MKPMTLASLHAQDMDLRVFCSVCGHFAVVPAEILLRVFPTQTPVQDTRHRLGCTKCGARIREGWEITVMPDWHIGKGARPYGSRGVV